jgi:8-hydroxy-5-deazaflavin:NADPH oxidoreductase
MSTTQASRAIAILGAGNVGTSLGGSLLRAGHRVIYGVRTPSKPDNAALEATGASLDDVPAAVARAEVVILATPWSAAESALRAAGDLGGRPLLDATNPLGPGLALTHGHTDSGGEQVPPPKW